MEKWAAEHDIEYIDGAIMTVPPMIGSDEALIFYGGQQAIFEKLEPILKLLGGNTVYLSPDPGVPMLYDLALLTMLYGVQQSWLHAHAMVSTAGISSKEFQPFVEEWFKNVILPGYSTSEAGLMLDEANYKTEVSNLHTNMLALEHIIKASKELSIPTDWMTPLKSSYDHLVAKGYGTDSPERAFELMKNHKKNSYV
ncbi:imine reductase family protein [Evansella halocellulosilytica]|uniref:imine reductase family protein n=1 Tax=Evansella halocellulosilytica TaxID=2011013 RepID=UPI00211D08A5|nr:hypothetical protein [Evansella halocellulosilytica]